MVHTPAPAPVWCLWVHQGNLLFIPSANQIIIPRAKVYQRHKRGQSNANHEDMALMMAMVLRWTKGRELLRSKRKLVQSRAQDGWLIGCCWLNDFWSGRLTFLVNQGWRFSCNCNPWWRHVIRPSQEKQHEMLHPRQPLWKTFMAPSRCYMYKMRSVARRSVSSQSFLSPSSQVNYSSSVEEDSSHCKVFRNLKSLSLTVLIRGFPKNESAFKCQAVTNDEEQSSFILSKIIFFTSHGDGKTLLPAIPQSSNAQPQ